MENSAFDTDNVLTDFLIDYADGNLGSVEHAVFKEYLSQNKREEAYAQKVVLGKKALSRLANHMRATTMEVSS